MPVGEPKLRIIGTLDNYLNDDFLQPRLFSGVLARDTQRTLYVGIKPEGIDMEYQFVPLRSTDDPKLLVENAVKRAIATYFPRPKTSQDDRPPMIF